MIREIHTVLICGYGVMGRGVAGTFAAAGFRTLIYSRRAASLADLPPGSTAFDRLPAAAPDLAIEFAPEDAALLALRGEARAGLGDPDGALADWRRALELEPEDIGALYSSAFLFEREGRLAEAVEAWRSIVAWSESRGAALETEWPRRELERLRRSLAET